MDIDHFKYFAVIVKIFIYNGLYFNIPIIAKIIVEKRH